MSREPLLGDTASYASTDSEKITSLHHEARFVVRSLAPLVITFFLQYLLSIISIYATGKLGATELAAASLAICSFNITGLAVYQGMATCLDSFCSQAYGAQRLDLVGVYFQRCLVMLLVLTVFPLAPMWWWSGLVLKYMVPDPKLAEMSQTYLRVCLAGAPGLLFFETSKRFLQAQHIFNAGTYVLAIAVPVLFLLNWVLVWHPQYGLGYIGAPIATSISYWLISLLMLAYVLLIDGRQCWLGFDIQKSFSNWRPMMKLALPGVVMVEAEYLAFEVLTILAASFGTEALAAQLIASNIGSLYFQLPFAVSVACLTRIGHFVGMRDLRLAALVSRLAVVIGALIALFNASTIFFYRHALTKFFSSDEEVVKIGAQVLTMTAINQLGDGFNVLEAGVLRGQGRQQIGSIMSIVAYYFIALPLGYVLAFIAGFGLLGLWGGLIAGVVCLAAGEFIAILRSDWPRIIEESEGRHDN